MFCTCLTIVLVVIAIPPNCLAEHSEIQPFLNKTYKLVSTDENFDKVLRKLNMNVLARKALELRKSNLTLTWNPTTNIYTLSEKTFLGALEDSFQIGKAFNKRTLDARDIQTLFTLEGSTLTNTEKEHGKPDFVIERTFSADHVVSKYQIKDLISYRAYDAYEF